MDEGKVYADFINGYCDLDLLKEYQQKGRNSAHRRWSGPDEKRNILTVIPYDEIHLPGKSDF